MSTVATRFSKVATRLGVGTAAVALVAATTLSSAGIAQADRGFAPVPQVGGNAGSTFVLPEVPGTPGTNNGQSVNGANRAATAAAAAAAANGIESIWQNKAWWFGPANPNSPPSNTVFTFTPLSLIPGFLRPIYSWFTQRLNFQVCVFGASVKIGPYGSVTGSVGRSC